jgi:nucleoside-diphosphate-sugar epimerase
MPQKITVAGFGAVGRAVAERLSARGDDVVVVQRSQPPTLPVRCTFRGANVEDETEAQTALADAGTVVCAVGIPYVSAIYQRDWPIVMRNMLTACAHSGARFVFADNLYMYGPQTRPLTEETPLTDYGRKPRVRAEITRQWQDAHARRLVRAVAVRASDFYGPDAPTSVLSTMGVARLLDGKSALAPYPPDNPHDFTYIRDFARAIVTLIDAPDDAYGQAWHVPNASTRSLRELLTLTASLIGVRPRVSVPPPALMPILGLFQPEVRELKEMLFQWDRPYLVDSSKFSRRFWRDPTTFEEGLQATIAFYRSTQG